jgi:hypothetical protein
MRAKWIIQAILLSLALHVLGPVVEVLCGENRKWVLALDSVMSWPAYFISTRLPPGHGFTQLGLPFVFSLIFYAVVFLILILFVDRSRREPASKK